MNWKRLSVGVAGLVAVVFGLVVPASPAQAGPQCDRPNPPPICHQDPDPPDVPGTPFGTAYFGQDGTDWRVSGSAGEPNGGPVWVDVKADGVLKSTVNPNAYGTYLVTLPASPAIGTICVTVRNINGVTVPLGCDGMDGPIGHVDSTQVGSTTVLTGWVFDPNTTGPVTVRIWDRPTSYVADQPRGDVANLYPGVGPYHGFTIIIPNNSWCVDVVATNIGAGRDTWLQLCLS